MLNGMLWIVRIGAQWRALSFEYGPWQSEYSHFKKWSEDGTTELVFKALSEDLDSENISIDSTIIPIHQSANGGQKKKN